MGLPNLSLQRLTLYHCLEQNVKHTNAHQHIHRHAYGAVSALLELASPAPSLARRRADDGFKAIDDHQPPKVIAGDAKVEH